MFTPSSVCMHDRVPRLLLRAQSVMKRTGTAVALLVISCSLRGLTISPHLGFLTNCCKCLQLLINSYISCHSRNPDDGPVCKNTANFVNRWEVWENNVLGRDADCSWVLPVWGEGTCDSLFINTLLKPVGLRV